VSQSYLPLLEKRKRRAPEKKAALLVTEESMLKRSWLAREDTLWHASAIDRVAA
jgi:hypothetical protein